MSKALECTNSEGAQIPFDGISLGATSVPRRGYLREYRSKGKKKTPDTQLVALSFGKEQQWPYRPYVYGNTNHSI